MTAKVQAESVLARMNVLDEEREVLEPVRARGNPRKQREIAKPGYFPLIVSRIEEGSMRG